MVAFFEVGSAVSQEKPMLRFGATPGDAGMLLELGAVCERLVSPEAPPRDAWTCAANTIQKAADEKGFRGTQGVMSAGCPGSACVHCRRPGGGMSCVPCLLNPRNCERICVCP
jgi:hypothetical protein